METYTQADIDEIMFADGAIRSRPIEEVRAFDEYLADPDCAGVKMYFTKYTAYSYSHQSGLGCMAHPDIRSLPGCLAEILMNADRLIRAA